MLTIYYLLSAMIGLAVAIHQFIRTPDPDRALVYPAEPAVWGGATGQPALHARHMVGSLLFWAIVLCVGGLTGAALSALLPESAVTPAVLAVLTGLAAAVWVATRLLRHGPGAMKALPSQRRHEPSRQPRTLFICGSLNQTTQMHQIAQELPEVEAHFTPFFSDHWAWVLIRKLGGMEMAISGYKRRRICLDYLTRQGLPLDLHGERYRYDMVVYPNDQLIPPSLRGIPSVLVQEGITDPPDWRTTLWRRFRLIHRVFAGTSTFGVSRAYERFCVASEGYRQHFAALGAPPERLVVTGIPNFDNFKSLVDNDFPYRDYVLVCTTDGRETFAQGDRHALLRRAVEIAAGRQLIFKLHPNERFDRAIREIKEVAPDALIYTDGSAEEMVANCAVLITEWSSLTFCGVALGKEVYSHHPIERIRELLPLQNGCAARNIADVCRKLLAERVVAREVPAEALEKAREVATATGLTATDTPD